MTLLFVIIFKYLEIYRNCFIKSQYLICDCLHNINFTKIINLESCQIAWSVLWQSPSGSYQMLVIWLHLEVYRVVWNWSTPSIKNLASKKIWFYILYYSITSYYITVHYNSLNNLFIHLEDASEEIAQLYRNSIITDGVVYAKMTNTEILKLVRAHLYAHVVRMPFGNSEQNSYTQVSTKISFALIHPYLTGLVFPTYTSNLIIYSSICISIYISASLSFWFFISMSILYFLDWIDTVMRSL